MSDEKLLALISARADRADTSGTFDEDRAKLIEYYLGAPFGNEVEGRSSVVMREIYSTIEWMKPALMRMFFGGQDVVKFTPTSAEDVAHAEQETDYVSYVIKERNDGFETLYSWFTDALLSANSYVVCYWDKRESVHESFYEQVSASQLVMLTEQLNGKGNEWEIVEADEVGTDDMGEPLFDVRLKETVSEGYVHVETIPPERLRVDASHKHVGLSRCNFVQYTEIKTISALREAGFDVADDIADDDSEDATGNIVEQARNLRQNKSSDEVIEEGEDDPASREVHVHTSFIRVDYDGDGKAELRRVCHVGSTVLLNETYDCIAVAALTPTIMPHRHVGMSIAEVVKDLQEIKSTLMRGMLDNMYLANNGRYAVNEDTVNLDDFAVSRPGGVVRVAGDPMTSVRELAHPSLSGNVIQAVEYLDMVLENRTGASPRVLQGQNFDGNAINKTASGISQIMSAAMARIELIGRIFAETGVRDLYRIVHALTLKHARKAEVVNLRNQWVPVDPREWDRRYNMTVEVGLGTGDKQGKISMLQMIIAAQASAMPYGVSSPQTMFNALSKLTEEAGYKNPEEFWVNPAKPHQPIQVPPKPEVQVQQAKIAADAQARQQEANYRRMGIEADLYKARLDAQRAQEKAFLDAQVDLAKFVMDKDSQAESQGLTVNVDGTSRDNMADTLMKLAAPRKPRRKVVKHIRGADGKIAASEVIEMEDDEEGNQ
jgi:hypothetical protein